MNPTSLSAGEARVLDAVLDAWARGNVALLNLLRALPAGAFDARALPDSPTIGQMCAHIHHERIVSVLENAPEAAGPVPREEWAEERDVGRITQLLTESCQCVADAVRARTIAGAGLDRSFAHPVQLVQFLIFHDGYHHGQMKLALKASRITIPDEVVGERVWDVWRQRSPVVSD